MKYTDQKYSGTLALMMNRLSFWRSNTVTKSTDSRQANHVDLPTKIEPGFDEKKNS